MLYKFRTMFIDSPAYAVNPLSSLDPRITKVGRWLRRSSIDELPQFLNVLIGNMSVVGPRPEMPFIVDRYNEIHRERLLVKPGITGIWQISAVRGEAIHENIEYDLFYIDNQSILLDVIIVLKTILVAVRGVGAY
jgi:lipopolysaccharide/colanic/teichoic acid biosynthesis glycosyltransferase